MEVGFFEDFSRDDFEGSFVEWGHEEEMLDGEYGGSDEDQDGAQGFELEGFSTKGEKPADQH